MSRALEGVRILDFSMFQAGPHATKLMGDMGAEIVKIEAPHHPDPLRLNPRDIYPDNDPGERPWNRSGMINERNRSKLGITLDLAAEEGRQLFFELVKVSDVCDREFQGGRYGQARRWIRCDKTSQSDHRICVAFQSGQHRPRKRLQVLRPDS